MHDPATTPPMMAAEHQALWDAMASEPMTGLTLMTIDGLILFLNAQAARIYFGKGCAPEQVMGRSIDELYPPQFCADRRAVLAEVSKDGRPRLFRAIWRGHQHLAWIYPVHSEEDGDGVDRALVVTRRTPGDAEQPLIPTATEYVEAAVNDLGPLEVLSPRELVVMALLGQGLALKEVAAALHRSVKTIETHRDAIGRKLRLTNRADLIHVARRAGLTVEDADRPSV